MPRGALFRRALAVALYLIVAVGVVAWPANDAGTMAIVAILNALGFGLAWSLAFGGRLSVLDPGLFFALVVTLYTALPLAAFAVVGLDVGALADNRLLQIGLTNSALATVSQVADCALAGFGISYLIFRKPVRQPVPTLSPYDLPATIVAFALSAMIVAALGVLSRGKTYADQYLFYKSLPVALLQVINIGTSLFALSGIALIIILCVNGRGRAYLFSGLAMAVFVKIFSDARTQIFYFVSATMIAYDHYRRAVKLRVLVPLVLVGLGGFQLLGALRDNGKLSDSIGASEFTAVFATGLDVLNLVQNGQIGDISIKLYLADLLRLIPQQLLPFDKIDPAQWYVTTFYPALGDSGGGLAFGMVAESLLTGGAVVAAVRGFCLAAMLSAALTVVARRPGLFKSVIYVWLFVSLYLCFRGTSFVLIAAFVYQIAPALALLWLLRWVVASSLAPSRRTPLSRAMTV